MQTPAFDYIRHGMTPFFRLAPWVGRVERRSSPQAVIVGVPYDGGTTHNPGARFAPYDVRQASATFQSYHPAHELDVFADLTVADGGNLVAPPFNSEGMRAVVQEGVTDILAVDAVPFVVGGDHSITLPVLRALRQQFGPIGVVHLDAHLDLSGPETWGAEHHHGTVFRHAIKEGLISDGGLHQVGIRASWRGADDAAAAAKIGGRLYGMDALDAADVRVVAETIRERLGGRPTYVSVDIDVVDPAFAPGTGTPVAGGMTSRELLRFLRGLAGTRLVGMDLVEICPALDKSDLTSHLGASILFEGLALLALGKRGRGAKHKGTTA